MAALLVWRQPERASEPQRSAVAPIAATPPSWEIAPPPKPYEILSRRGTKAVRVEVRVPATATREQLHAWSIEIMRAEGRGGPFMINYFDGPADVDHMIASYSDGDLYDMRGK